MRKLKAAITEWLLGATLAEIQRSTNNSDELSRDASKSAEANAAEINSLIERVERLEIAHGKIDEQGWKQQLDQLRDELNRR